MIVTSRLCRPAYTAFDGTGGLYRAGRWHQQGHRVIYAADSEALAALEILVHLSSFTQIPEYACVKARIPDELVLNLHEFAPLPIDWASPEPMQARALGTRWLIERTSAVLRVPSVVIPRESNYMFNPEHPEFIAIAIDPTLQFEFDVRLVSRPQQPSQNL